MAKRRRFTDRFEAKVPLEALRGDKTIQELRGEASGASEPGERMEASGGRRDGGCVLCVFPWRQARGANGGRSRRGPRQNREAGGRDRVFVRRAEATSPDKTGATIDRDRPDPSIDRQCKPARPVRSAVYSTPVGLASDTRTTTKTMKETDRVFTKYPVFGSHRIAASLRREGTGVGRRRVRRVRRPMAWMGLEAIYKRLKPDRPHPKHPVRSSHTHRGKRGSTARTGSGARTSPSCLSRMAFRIRSRSWTGPRARSRVGGSRTRYTRSFASTPRTRPSPSTAQPGS